MDPKNKAGISVFQKYLTLWVILCMVVGVLIGKFLPQIPTFLNQCEDHKQDKNEVSIMKNPKLLLSASTIPAAASSG